MSTRESQKGNTQCKSFKESSFFLYKECILVSTPRAHSKTHQQARNNPKRTEAAATRGLGAGLGLGAAFLGAGLGLGAAFLGAGLGLGAAFLGAGLGLGAAFLGAGTGLVFAAFFAGAFLPTANVIVGAVKAEAEARTHARVARNFMMVNNFKSNSKQEARQGTRQQQSSQI